MDCGTARGLRIETPFTDIHAAALNNVSGTLGDGKIVFGDRLPELCYDGKDALLLPDGQEDDFVLVLISRSGDIEIQKPEELAPCGDNGKPEAEPNAEDDWTQGRASMEIELPGNSGLLVMGSGENEVRIVLDADGSAACDRGEFRTMDEAILIDGISANLEFGKWLLSFRWAARDGKEAAIPFAISSSDGVQTRARLFIPDGTVEIEETEEEAAILEATPEALKPEALETKLPESAIQVVPGEEAPAKKKAYFSFEMDRGFVEIGDNLLRLNENPGLVREGEAVSRDFRIGKPQVERESDGAWRITYEFSKGDGEAESVPVKFIDENGGMFAAIVTGDDGNPVLSVGEDASAGNVYGNFSAFYGDSPVVFFADGMAGTPVDDGARFVLRQGILSIFHMGEGRYVYELDSMNEGDDPAMLKPVLLKLVDAAGDEAEISLNFM